MWLVVALAMALGIAGFALARKKRARLTAILWLMAGLTAAAVALSRIFAVPVLGWRAGWLLAGLMALAPVAILAFRQSAQTGFLADIPRALAFLPPQANQPPSLLVVILWLALHLVGLAAVFSVIRVPISYAPLVVLIPLVLGVVKTRVIGSSRTAGLLALSPFLIPYAVLALRVLAGVVTRFTLGEYKVIEPWASIFNLPFATLVMTAYAAALSVFLAVKHFARAFAITLIALTVAWAGWTALELRTRGVSGSDPYAYAQMGVDLATRGTIFHSFPLVRVTYELGIPSAPIIHVGYKIPGDVRREATTVWPPGYAIFTALGYLAAGENGLFLITPLLSLLSLAAIAGLVFALTSRLASPVPRLVMAALTVFLTATSYQQVEWQLIPMADIAAQLFSVLALLMALLAAKNSGKRAWLWAALAGLALGIAFDVRYTQVLLAPALVVALANKEIRDEEIRNKTVRSRNPFLFLISYFSNPALWIAALCALLAVLPVFAYHTLAFGGPFAIGSEEHGNFDLFRIPETFIRTMNEWLSVREYGLLWPLILVGAFWMWRNRRRELIVLAAYFVPAFLFHLWYWPLRLRDILFLFPVLTVLASMGATQIFASLRLGEKMFKVGLRAVLILILVFAISFRSLQTLELPLTHGFGAFGYLVKEQRAAFDLIRQNTPANAVIASSLNSGAIDLHAGRAAFRPATWSADELEKFVRQLQKEGAPVFILADGDELAASLQTLQNRFGLREVIRADVPYYFPGSGSENRKAPLYEVQNAK